jgi:hypothetical protein
MYNFVRESKETYCVRMELDTKDIQKAADLLPQPNQCKS